MSEASFSGAAQTASSSQARAWLSYGLKAVVSGALLLLLAKSSSFHWEKLWILLEDQRLLAASLGLWLGVNVLLSGLRFGALLRASSAQLPLPRIFALQMTALFFNGVVPGNVGGDVLKAHYALPKQTAQQLGLVLMERVLGLAAMLLLSFALVLPQLGSLPASLRPLTYSLSLLSCGSLLLLPVLYLLRTPQLAQRLLPDFLLKRGPLSRLWRAGEELAQKPFALGLAFGYSLLIHGGNLAYFALVSRVLVPHGPSLEELSLIYPLGMLTVILPISLSGLGVGHLAFEQLYQTLGYAGGAEVFHVFLLGGLLPTLSGALPWLFLRKETPPIGAASAAPELTQAGQAQGANSQAAEEEKSRPAQQA